jgi:hypothetical protein
MNDTERIVAAIREGDLSTRDLVLISFALAARGANTTSVLGQYGEELVAAAYRGTIGSFDQKGYDVLTDSGERLQVKTYTKGRRAGAIRSFGFDVITVEIDPSDAAVVSARRYIAGDLFAQFRSKVGVEIPAHQSDLRRMGRYPDRSLRPRLDDWVERAVDGRHRTARASGTQPDRTRGRMTRSPGAGCTAPPTAGQSNLHMSTGSASSDDLCSGC